MLEKHQSPSVAQIEQLLLTTAQVAEVLNVSKRTVESLLLNGTLHSVKLGGARRVHIDALKDFAREGAAKIGTSALSRREVAEMITDVVANDSSFGESSFANKLWQISAHHVRVIDHKPKSIDELNRTVVFHSVALLLRLRLKQRTDAKLKSDGQYPTANERRVIKHLDAAIDAFNAATDGFKSTVTPHTLAEQIWSNFYGVAVDEARADAAAIYAATDDIQPILIKEI